MQTNQMVELCTGREQCRQLYCKNIGNPCIVVSIELALLFGTETTVGGLQQPKIIIVTDSQIVQIVTGSQIVHVHIR